MRLIPLHTPLRSDYANLGELALPELRTALADPKNPALRRVLEEQFLAIGQTGSGVSEGDLPEITLQNGFECVPHAILNGAMIANPKIRGMISRLRPQLLKCLKESPYGEKTIVDGGSAPEGVYGLARTIEIFRGLGLPIDTGSMPTNPLAFAGRFFRNKSFAIKTTPGSNLIERHATALVPAHPCHSGCVAFEIDSLQKTPKEVSVQTLVDDLLTVTGEPYSSSFWVLGPDVEPIQRLLRARSLL